MESDGAGASITNRNVFQYLMTVAQLDTPNETGVFGCCNACQIRIRQARYEIRHRFPYQSSLPQEQLCYTDDRQAKH
jgi:hypothetical protein